jgi:hypothetical protein
VDFASPQAGLLADAPLKNLPAHALRQFPIVGVARGFRRIHHDFSIAGAKFTALVSQKRLSFKLPPENVLCNADLRPHGLSFYLRMSRRSRGRFAISDSITHSDYIHADAVAHPGSIHTSPDPGCHS